MTSSEEEGKLYQYIFELSYKGDKEEKEEVQSTSRSEQKPEQTTDNERSTHEAGISSGAMSENKTKEQRPKLHSEYNTSWVSVGSLTSLTLTGETELCSHTTRSHSEPENTQETPAMSEKTERKPWREPGADITDYFNYGFDEESWNSYQKKYAELHNANKKHNAKTYVLGRHCTHEDREPGCASTFSSYPSSTLARRQSLTGCKATRWSDRFGRPPWLSREEEQVRYETFAEEDSITTYALPFLYPPYGSYNPPHVPFRQSSHLHRYRTSNSENPEHRADPSMSLNPNSSGATSLIPEKWAHRAGEKKSANTWERIIRKEKSERGYYDRYKKRSKDRERDKASSACSRREQQRCKKTTKPEQSQQTLESVSSRQDDRAEKKHRGIDRREKSSHSDRGRNREPGEVSDSERSHRRKKKKKKNKKKKTSTADGERK